MPCIRTLCAFHSFEKDNYFFKGGSADGVREFCDVFDGNKLIYEYAGNDLFTSILKVDIPDDSWKPDDAPTKEED